MGDVMGDSLLVVPCSGTFLDLSEVWLMMSLWSRLFWVVLCDVIWARVVESSCVLDS